MDSKINALESNLQTLQNELNAQKKVTKNALKFSVIIGLLALFFIAFNFSVLLTTAGGIAGSDRKLNALQEKVENLQRDSLNYKENIESNPHDLP
ncbi:hypothetical protein DCO58_01800 [Helicobacter saguini]|uniref:Uncharacterized protein n=1 Tax=Helicobacter saguini TaxID=1548018 RepID=A0A347VU58_9HELI|nr:hypothetical protein [Helicobacter saguini]MWV66445.1 hypothetical protein [Helicobacter saguini]MWV68794.1 hypothetical protein [Helicobacter saguini]MWV71651.1 hypothetical protein [Helicobacter saguini]TLD94484.1 hypothetical protein LS64_005870 [Helicobacter saguini]